MWFSIKHVCYTHIPSEYGQVVMLQFLELIYNYIPEIHKYLLRDKGQILIPVGGYVLATPIFILLSY